MKLLGATIVAVAALCGVGLRAQAQGGERAYKVIVTVVSGNSNFCVSEHFWVRESGGKFRLFDLNNKKELWALPMAADGSVNGEARIPFGHMWRLNVPPGSGPRAWTAINLSQACNYRIVPAG